MEQPDCLNDHCDTRAIPENPSRVLPVYYSSAERFTYYCYFIHKNEQTKNDEKAEGRTGSDEINILYQY